MLNTSILISLFIFIYLITITLLIIKCQKLRAYKKEYEDKLQQLQKDHENLFQKERLNAISELAAGLAHNYNNIIGSLKNYYSLLLGEEKNSENWKNYTLKIEELIDRTAKLSDDILTFAHIPKTETKALAPIKPALQTAITIFKRTFPKSITIEASLSIDDLYINCKINHFFQLLLNLALNAKAAMPKGGRLSISAEKITISHKRKELPPGTYCLITISDTGIGIKEENLDKIFNAFFTTKPPGESTGFGLTIAQNFIKEMKGSIKVNSIYGKGTTFSIHLPTEEKKLATRKKLSANNITQTTAKSIFFIDDEEYLLISFSELLKKRGHMVFTASNSTEALEEYQNIYDMIDIAIIDYHMDHMDGLELLQQMKKINPGIKAILITGGETKHIEERESLNETSAIIATLKKPFGINELILEINRL